MTEMQTISFKHRWNTIKVMKSHTLEISGMQPALSESNCLPDVKSAEVLMTISSWSSRYVIKCCQVSFYLPSSGYKALRGLREQMWYLQFCSEQSGCFENIHRKTPATTPDVNVAKQHLVFTF